MMTRHSFTGLTGFAFLTFWTVSHPALGQSLDVKEKATITSDDAQSGLSDIVVTARKVAENLQDVPVAVTAFTGEQLVQQNALNLSDVSGVTPGLRIVNFSHQGPISLFSLRGQVQTSPIATVDPSVGVYVDGIYWARSYGINADLLDVQSVQTLKGPQGTLFGRNTTGGAILIETQDPSFDRLSGEISATYGRFDYKSGRIIANVPIIADKIAIRAAYEKIDSDGFAFNPLHPDQPQGERDSQSARFKVLANLTDDLSVLLSANFWDAKYRTDPARLSYVPATATASNLQAGAYVLGSSACLADRPTCIATGTAAIGAYIDQIGTGNVVPLNQISLVDAKSRTLSARISQDTAFGNIKIIGGWRRVKSFTTYDFDGSPFAIAQYSDANQDMRQWSIETQVTGKAFDNRLTYAGGMFYFKESGIDSTSFSITPIAVGTLSRFSGDIDNESVGLYGQASFALTDKLTATGGLRWSRDRKAVTIDNGTFQQQPDGAIIPGTFVCTVAAGCPTTRSGSFSGISYLAGLDYKFTPEVLGYVKTARGFRSGGVNLRETTALPDVPVTPFRPETATSYEAGLKSEFFDRHVRLNLAAFYTIVKDLQRQFTVFQGTASTTIAGNAGRADFYGGEAELDALLVDNSADQIRMGISAAHVHPRYVDYVEQSGFDRSRERFNLVPEWQFAITGNYKHEFGSGMLSLNANYQWESSYATEAFDYFVDASGVIRNATNNQVIASRAVAEATRQATTKPASGIVNVRATYLFGVDKQFELAAWGRNILDDRSVLATSNLLAFSVSSIRREPATYGLTGTVRF